MPKFEMVNSYGQPAAAVFDAAARAVADLRGWKLLEVNRNAWYITASVSFNFWSYGEDITIQVTEPTPGRPSLTAVSSSKLALVDWGKNRANLRKLFAEIDAVLARMGMAPAAAGNARPQPRGPGAGGSREPGFCPGCGAPRSEAHRFCQNCGRSLSP